MLRRSLVAERTGGPRWQTEVQCRSVSVLLVEGGERMRGEQAGLAWAWLERDRHEERVSRLLA